MTVAAAGLRLKASEPQHEPRRVIAWHVFRRAWRGAAIWGAVFGIVELTTVQAFVKGYPTRAERLELAQSLRAMEMLLGVLRHADTVAGFTSWRVLMMAALMGAIWGLLTSTGLLRGEEDAGRWELLLTGRTTMRHAVGEALAGLGGALGTMFLATLVLTLVAARLPGAHFPPANALLLAVGLVSGAAMFLAVGAVASQVSATRGQAAMIAAGVLGGAYVVRMIADTSASRGWVRWLSPLGWLEELRPLQEPNPLALVPVVALVATCVGLTLFLAGRRDLGASVLRERNGQARETRWLVGPTSLAVRLSRTAALGWLIGLAAMGLMYGSLTRSAASILSGSPTIASTLGKLGIKSGAEGYLGMTFFFVAIVVSILAATQVVAARDEEASGRIDNLLTRPVPRVAWLVGRLGVTLALVLLAGVVAGLFMWLGAANQRTGVPMWKLLEAGVNATIPAIFVVGASGLVLGLRPRLTSVAAYGMVAWSFLANMLGGLLKNADWLRDSSLYSHIAMAPATKPDWGEATVVVLLGLAAAALGAIAFQRRDVEYG